MAIIPKDRLLSKINKDKLIAVHQEKLSKFMKLFLKVSEYLGWKTLILMTIFTTFLVYFFSFFQSYKTILFIIFIYVLYLILQTSAFVYESIKLLLDDGKKSITKLFSAYIISIIGLMILFALFYAIAFATKTGYLTYSQCSDEFNKQMIYEDNNLVLSNFGYLYFSAITFFSVGYGDICPMGSAKFISILNTWLGHAYTVIVLGLAMAVYTKDNDKKE